MPTDIEDAVRPLNADTVMGLLADRSRARSHPRSHRPRVLALGEPTHGEDVLLQVRNEIFRELVEREGYRTIAIESDCLTALAVDDYITSDLEDPEDPDRLDEVLRHGFSHGFGAAPGSRALVQWMRGHNRGRPESDRVRFAGIDGPLEMAFAASPRRVLTALHAFITDRAGTHSVPWSIETIDALLGSDDLWTEPEAMMDPARSVGGTPEAKRLRLIADDLAASLDMQAPLLARTSSADEWHRARLYARTAQGLLRYHSWMADDSPERITQLLAIRAHMMAGNVLAAAQRGPVLLHAHNAHLQRDMSQIRMGGIPMDWWSAGAIVDTELGPDYAFFATALGTIRHRDVETPAPNTIEGVLYALPSDRCLIDPRSLGTGLVPRSSEWFGYAPLDPSHLDAYDGVVFIKDAPAQ